MASITDGWDINSILSQWDSELIENDPALSEHLN